MPAPSLGEHRSAIRHNYLAPESDLVPALADKAALDHVTRRRAQENAADFVTLARENAVRSGLIDKFLQEYGLSTAEGVTLMRLAEALLRTPDAATANALIEDKIEAGDWASHAGASPFPLVNFSTRALMLTAAWLDDIEAKDPLRRMAAATKNALDRLGEPVIRASVAQAMRIMGEHFVLGETIEAALDRAEKFAQSGYLFSFDMLGEAAHTEKDAQKYYRDYEDAITAIAKQAKSDNPADNPGISVKLSALHPRYEYGKKERVLRELGERMRALALKAKEANIGFTIDAEEADRLDISLDLFEQIMRDPAFDGWQGFGVVVQAYQRRATFVLDWLETLSRDTGRRLMVRLVKGAYWDSEIKRAQVMGLDSYPVFTRKVSTDLSYLACARKLLSATDVFYPQFATHNALTATMVREMAGNYADYELQRLHGMGEALHDSLIARGARSRVYAPVGGHKELLPYLVRRLLENGANSSFVNQLIDPDLSVDDVVVDPFVEFAETSSAENPLIPSPLDHLGDGRRVSKGFDETHPPTAASMSPEARKALAAIPARAIINGELRSGVIEPVGNPAHKNDAIGSVESITEKEVNDACEAAGAFAETWASTPVADRAAALRRAGDLLEERADHFMQVAVFEAGKSWPDAVAEFREAVDFLRYYADEAEKLEGKPLGVVACISPWNFPLAIFLGQVSAGLAAGNCVVAKPAGPTPIIAFEAVKLLHEAGIPAGALHFTPGGGREVGAPLVAHPSVQGVIFTGSTGVAQGIKQSLVETGKYDAALIAETGGINAMIVDSTALLEQAVTDTIASAFQSAGQRCSACRIVCVQEDVADRFNEMLAGAMAELKPGDPSMLSTDVGPVIDHKAMADISRHIERLEEKATLIGKAPDIANDVDGTFIRPAAYEVASVSDVKEEIFGPVLHVIRFPAEKLEALIDEINSIGFGLTMGAHTRIDDTMHAIARRARVGNLYVNRNQIGAIVGVQPFGGEGLSGTGPKAGGPHYLKALVQRPRPNSENRAEIRNEVLPKAEHDDLDETKIEYHGWNNSDRGAVLRKAAEKYAPARQALQEAAHAFDTIFRPSIELPGPTGEANTLRLRGRGVALCLGGGDKETSFRQIAMALAAGNCVIATDPCAAELATAIETAAELAPGLIHCFPAPVRESLLQDSRVSLVVFDGGADGRADIENRLAQRQGSIIPLLSSLDAPWRFATERTLSINTTAAGGDVRLLSLSE